MNTLDYKKIESLKLEQRKRIRENYSTIDSNDHEYILDEVKSGCFFKIYHTTINICHFLTCSLFISDQSSNGMEIRKTIDYKKSIDSRTNTIVDSIDNSNHSEEVEYTFSNKQA